MIKIYYFSGTGNSLWTAKKIAQSFNGSCELYNIGVEAMKDEIILEADNIIFVFPSYAYGLPLIVRRFVKAAVIKARYVVTLVTYGSSPGGTLGAMRRLLLKKNSIAGFYFGRIPAVENYLAMFGPPKEKKKNARLAMQEKATEDAIRAIHEKCENKANTFTPFSSLVSLLFSLGIKIFYKRYKVSGNCSGCGICEKLCPVGAINMENGKPCFTGKCEHCQSCVNICPLRAIRFGRVKFGTPGYRHPGIEIGELYRQEMHT